MDTKHLKTFLTIVELTSFTRAARRLGLRHVVLTSVTRDDLPDGGAAHWAQTISAVRREAPGATVEALVPDFGGDTAAIGRKQRIERGTRAHDAFTLPLAAAVSRGR